MSKKREIPPPKYDPKDVAFKTADLSGYHSAATKHSHYHKQWGNETVDVYSVLDMFEVNDQAIGHAIKKLLMGGQRGHKDTLKDWQEAIDSINRAIQIKQFKEKQ